MKAGFFIGAALALAVSAPAVAADTPMRTLTYSFNYGMQQSTTVHNSGFANGGDSNVGNGAGVDSYANHKGTTGTITVAVQKEEADKGLLVMVSEQSDAAKLPPARCVVYGSGTVLCDPNASVNPEQYTVLRFLGANFIDPSLLDAKQHWQMASESPTFSATSDYTIRSNANGMMTIEETRSVTYRQMMNSKAAVTSSLTYDYTHQVPTAITEMTVSHTSHSGQDRDQTVTVAVKLASDSMAAH